MADTDDKTFTIQGVKVLFPCKPYPSQFSMMDRVIKGLERRQNCLLESPTGSGKSLALLCSALAWQFAENEKAVRGQLENLDKKDGCSKCNDSDIQQIDDDSKNVEMTSCTVALNPNKSKAEIVPGLDVNDDDDFKPFSIIRSSLSQVMKVLKRTYQSISYETSPKAASLGFHGDSDMTDIKSSTCHCSCKDSGSSGQKRKVPKIFYGTRTHKQITQIAKELGKTAYREVRMVILASREHTCINPDVACMKSKSEGCKERIDIRGLGCKFKDKSQRVLVNQSQLQEAGLNTAWDLEDLVKIGRKHKACPYFVLRNVLSQADIILCPYNYLIDPTIRKSMEINLKDNVIILDEAHNIEDAAREAASESILLDDLTQAIQNLNDLVENHISFPEHLELKSMCERLQHFLEENSSHLEQNDYNQAYRCWSGFDIVARLTSIQLGPNDFLRYQKLYDKLLSEEQNETLIRNQKNQMVRRSNGTSQLLERLFKVLDYMYRDDMKFVDDYRVALQKSVTYASSHDTDSTWLTSRQKHGGRKTSPSWQFSINFWCMNPAVAFSDLSVTRNVILSSGTLSPMNSFQSELGVPFPVHLEANHIIESDRVWVGAVGQGPTGRSLQAVYKTMESFDFQDELGNLIHKVCMNVPHGVLCFVPSYRALEKFTGRWRNTGLWGKLLQRKRVVVEPRASEKVDFEECMKYFYDSVLGDAADNGEEVDTSEVDGALFFAVCRGKVSEGLDFADNNARAVITVGIPYPSIKDNQVKLKKEYNDKHKASRGLLSGNEWYEIQAYRALNQALGRCIRHRKDWGALIIVDERFVVNREKYCKGLSKWVRNKVQSYNKFESAMESLSEFTAKFEKETRICADTSFIPPSPSTPKYPVYQSKNNSFKSPSLTSPTLKLDEKQFLPQSPVIPPSIPFQIENRVSTPPTIPSEIQNRLSTPPTIPSEIKHGITTQPATQFELKNGVTTPPTIPSEIKKRLSTPPTNPFEIETGAVKSVSTKRGKPLLISPPSQEKIYEKLKAVINSPTVPKDKPYCVLMNEGTPNEQKFLIKPAKQMISLGTGLASAVPGQLSSVQILVPTPENVPPVQVLNLHTQNMSLPVVDGQHANPANPAMFLYGTRPLHETGQTVMSMPTDLPARSVIHNMFVIPNKVTDTEGKMSEINGQHTLAARNYQTQHALLNHFGQQLVSVPPVSAAHTLTPQAVPLFISEGKLIQEVFAVEEPMLLTTQGQNHARTNGNNAKKQSVLQLQGPKYTTADSSTSTSSPMASLLQTLPWKPALSTCSNSALGTDVINMTSKDSTEKTGTNNAQNNQANTAGKSWEKIDKIKSSGFDPYVTENKFLKFCNIVKKEKPEENSSGPILNLQKTSKTEPEGRSVAPVLLKGNIEKLKIEKGKFDKMKRPLFRRRIIKMESDISYKDSSCEISEMKIDGSVSLKDENKPAIENCVFDIKEKVECGNQFEMEANDRKGTTKNQEIGKGDTREMINNILEKDNMHPNMSDEEVIDNVLNTRRRRGKRTSSLVKHNAKKSRVRYIEENSSKGDEGKETQVHNLSCSSCGSSFLAVSALVKTRDVPKFWTERCGSELIQIENLDPQSSFEVAVADPQASVTLNCLWCADLQCGVQFLKCSTCRKTNKGGNPTGIIGARILFTSEGCKDFAQGQTWLLSSAVKTTLD